jgi:hypothetical protein
VAERGRQPDSVDVYVMVDRAASRARSVWWKYVGVLAAVAVLLVAGLAVRGSGGGPKRVQTRPAVRVARPVARLDADGDLDGSVKTLRLHFDPDDAR